jgi:hypothetical protein
VALYGGSYSAGYQDGRQGASPTDPAKYDLDHSVFAHQ